METPSHPPTGLCRGVCLCFALAAAFYNQAADKEGRPLFPFAAHLPAPGHPIVPPRFMLAGVLGSYA